MDEDIRKAAAEELRFEVGTLPHLGDPIVLEEKGEVHFPIKFRLINLEKTQEEGEYHYFDEVDTIGFIVVDSETKEVTHRTPNDVINELARQYKKRNKSQYEEEKNQ